MYIFTIRPDGTHRTIYTLPEEFDHDVLAEQVSGDPYHQGLAADVNLVRHNSAAAGEANPAAMGIAAAFGHEEPIYGTAAFTGGMTAQGQVQSLREDQQAALADAAEALAAKKRQELPLTLDKAQRATLLSAFTPFSTPQMSADSVTEPDTAEETSSNTGGWIAAVIAALVAGVIGTILVMGALADDPEDQDTAASEELDQREEELDARESELDTREAELEADEEALEEDQEEVSTTRTNLNTRETELEEREEDVEEREDDLEPREEELDDREEELDEREEDLNSRESGLDTREEELEDREEAVEQAENNDDGDDE